MYRLRATRRHLLKQALETVVPPSSASQPAKLPQAHRRTKSHLTSSHDTSSSQLPPELMDLLLLLPAFVAKAATTPPAALEVLLANPPFSSFPALLPQLAPVLSAHLTAQASTLARTVKPSTNPSFVHRAIPTLAAATKQLQAALGTTRRALAAGRRAAAAQLAGHLDQHVQALALLLRALDAKHGPAAHSTALRARGAALEARLWAVGLELLLWETRARLYPPEAQPALRAYRRHLRDAGMRLRDDTRTREQELREYGVAVPPGDDGHDEDDEVRGQGGDEGKERTMRELARVWNDMQARLTEVRGDLQRLDGT